MRVVSAWCDGTVGVFVINYYRRLKVTDSAPVQGDQQFSPMT